MGKCSGMSCCFCDYPLEEAEYIAVDDSGEIIAMCEECYNKAEKFFKTGGKKNVQSGFSDKRPEQEVQDKSDK